MLRNERAFRGAAVSEVPGVGVRVKGTRVSDGTRKGNRTALDPDHVRACIRHRGNVGHYDLLGIATGVIHGVRGAQRGRERSVVQVNVESCRSNSNGRVAQGPKVGERTELAGLRDFGAECNR